MSDARGKSVLVIDDEPCMCEMIRYALGAREMECTSVADSGVAKGLLERQDYDAVVCDVAMPGLSGLDLLDVCRQVRPNVPFILITGRGNVEDAKRAIREGAYEYLEKPFDVNRLCLLIEEATVSSGTPRALAEAPSAGPACDALTGLGTPRLLYEHLAQARLTSLADRRDCALIVLDIDDFAEVNRIFGYAFGDEALRAVGKQIRRRFGPAVPVCRLADDLFAVALAGADEAEGLAHAQALRQIVGRMRMSWNDHAISLSICAGVAETGPGFALSESELLAHAEQAMKEAKRNGCGGVCGYRQISRQAGGQLALIAGELHAAAEEAKKIDRELRRACLESVGALVSAVEAKDPYTRRHSDQVAYYAEQLARQTGLAGDIIETIRVAALVHDVGKIGIPDTVLTKPGKLTSDEFQLIREHPRMGANILRKISLLNDESRLVRHHHENWDGRGYPDGLAGEKIPLGARIIQLADCIDAMLMRRTYKAPYPVEKVLEELRLGRGRQFDPALADAALAWMQANSDKIIRPAE